MNSVVLEANARRRREVLDETMRESRAASAPRETTTGFTAPETWHGGAAACSTEPAHQT